MGPKPYKFISRLIVGIALIVLAGVILWNLFNTIIIPSLPVKNGADYVQDISGSMSDPDKTYARNAIEEASKETKIAIVLDYQLTSFDITDSYIDKTVGTIVNNVYRNQPYVVYTYFADKDVLYISTNINDTAKDVVSKEKQQIETDAKVVKEILYYQQNLTRQHGLKNWNFNLNSEYLRNACIGGVGSIILLILGIGVLPTLEEGLRNPFRRKKAKSNHSS